MDFTHHFYDSGLRIVLGSNGEANLISSVLQFQAIRTFGSSLASPLVLEFFICLVVFILIAAHLLWATERGPDSGIDDKYFPGIFQAIYFATVTSSTVGFGDITAKKWLGRLSVLLLILTGIAFFCNFTALLSSDYTTEKIALSISGPEDLAGKVVATKQGTTSIETLNALGAKVVTYETIEEAYNKLLFPGIDENPKLTAVVFDAPSIIHFSRGKGAGKVTVVGDTFDKQYYGFALPQGSEHREEINRAILELRANGTYDKLLRKWFGKS